MHLAVPQASCRGEHGSDLEHSKHNYCKAVSGTVFHWVSTVTTVTRLWDGGPRSRGSILGRGNTFFTSPKRPDRLWVQPNLLFYAHSCLFRAEHKADLHLITCGCGPGSSVGTGTDYGLEGPG